MDKLAASEYRPENMKKVLSEILAALPKAIPDCRSEQRRIESVLRHHADRFLSDPSSSHAGTFAPISAGAR